MADLLAALRAAGGKPLSGRSLGEALGVSRAGVWKRIQALRLAGHRIEALPGRGYLLRAEADLLNRETVGPLLGEGMFRPERCHFFAELDSSNEEAVTRARADAPEGTVIIADSQTRGRGRLGRSWSSPKGVNLYFSVILRPRVKPDFTFQLTLLAGLAMAEALTRAGVAGVSIKWPNDIHLHGRKLGGILTEMVAEPDCVQYVVVGVGLNVNMPAAAFDPELALIAATLMEAPPLAEKGGGAVVDSGPPEGPRWSRAAILAGFLARLDFWYGRYLAEGFAPLREGWLGFSSLMGRRVQVNLLKERFAGEALEMDPQGFLLVRSDEGAVRKVIAGDVALLP